MHLIVTNSELEIGREYWVRRKNTKYPIMAMCVPGYGGKKMIKVGEGSPLIETDNTVLSIFMQWDIVGPIPVRSAPDFDELIKDRMTQRT
jgi:hypothetical protein